MITKDLMRELLEKNVVADSFDEFDYTVYIAPLHFKTQSECVESPYRIIFLKRNHQLNFCSLVSKRYKILKHSDLYSILSNLYSTSVIESGKYFTARVEIDENMSLLAWNSYSRSRSFILHLCVKDFILVPYLLRIKHTEMEMHNIPAVIESFDFDKMKTLYLTTLSQNPVPYELVELLSTTVVAYKTFKISEREIIRDPIYATSFIDSVLKEFNTTPSLLEFSMSVQRKARDLPKSARMRIISRLLRYIKNYVENYVEKEV